MLLVLQLLLLLLLLKFSFIQGLSTGPGSDSGANVNHTCFHEDRVNHSAMPPTDGRFTCPEAPGNIDQTECCGPERREFCCSHWDSVGMKWAIGIGITVAVVIFMALGYTIQLFRACDRCYHEFPVLCEPEQYQFAMDTRWYTVSHEGNRYGVTFHSMRFASHFMHLLEVSYGPWNAANILRIKRDEQDFVVLHIFFNDFFTPWFYTQGPIKNDEEWIRTDFKDLCHRTQDDLAIRLPACCCPTLCKKSRYTDGHNNDGNKSENIELIIVPPPDDSICECDNPEPGGIAGASGSNALLSPTWTSSSSSGKSYNGSLRQQQFQQQQQQQLQQQLQKDASGPVRKKDHRPWTKHTFKVRPPPRPASPCGSQNRTQQQQQQQQQQHNQHRATTVIREDIIECYGNDKCIQTRCEIYI